MNRKYDLNTFINNVKKIQTLLPDIAITTDVIVGFPQESDEDFNMTLSTCKTLQFSKIHVFPFSSRKGTVASKMPNQINGIIKKQRAKQLIALSDSLNEKYNNKYVNKTLDVLVEEKVDNYYVGHTSNFIKVLIETTNVLDKNSIIKVNIIKAYTDHVLAREV